MAVHHRVSTRAPSFFTKYVHGPRGTTRHSRKQIKRRLAYLRSHKGPKQTASLEATNWDKGHGVDEKVWGGESMRVGHKGQNKSRE